MMRFKTPVFALLAITAALTVITGCSRQRSSSTSGGTQGQAIQVKGSDTMVNLGSAWAEAYMKEHPQANIAVTGGGSGTGIAAIIDGRADIAQASRAMKPEEIKLARERGADPVEHVVATDALSVIVNPANPVSKLTIDQLSDIFTGKITNWKEVGGPNEKIILLSRDKSSGSHVFFLEHVLRRGNEKGPEEFAKSALMLPSTEAIATQVVRDKAAIGYVGLGYVDHKKHKTIAVAKAASGPFVQPTLDTAENGTYPIARPLYWYTNGLPNGEIKSFLDFALSDAGQKIVDEAGFAHIKKKS